MNPFNYPTQPKTYQYPQNQFTGLLNPLQSYLASQSFIKK